jgi:hypothetical protein
MQQEFQKIPSEFVPVSRPYETIQLNHKSFNVTRAVSKRITSASEFPAMVETAIDDGAEMILAHIRSLVLSQHLETLTLKAPSDWWQAFKERWAPRWFLDKYPVEYTVKSIEIAALFPKMVTTRGMGDPIMIGIRETKRSR